MKSMFSQATESQFQQLESMYPEKRSALVPMLLLAQKEHGWIEPKVIAGIATRLGLSPSDVESVVSFYTLLHSKPVGEHVILVCTNLSCMLCGSDDIERALTGGLGIRMGQTTPDGKFSLIEAECLGSCTTAPVIQVNGEFHESLDAGKVIELLGRLRDKPDHDESA